MQPGTVPRPLDDPTFTALLQGAMPTLRAFLRRLCGSEADADDVLQETLAKVWRLRANFDAAQPASGWLHQAAFRCFCDHRRRQRATPAVAIDLGQNEARREACVFDLRDELHHRLTALEPMARNLLLAFHRDGRSLRELSEQHGMPINTVKSHLHRARQRLAAARAAEQP